MVIRSFIPVLIVSISFFVLLLEMVDLFANLWRYLNQGVGFAAIIHIQLLYLPKCISFALPISVLFSTAYCMGEFYGRNELIAVFGAGVSLFRFIVPFLAAGFILSVFGFLFEENRVIDSYRLKNEMVRDALNQSTTFSNSNITILGENIRIIYHADYYNDQNSTLSGLLIVKRDDKGRFLQRIDADTGVWQDDGWVLNRARVFTLAEGEIAEERFETLQDPELTSTPASFRKISRNVEEMKREDAREWILTLRKAGLPYREALTEYHKRYSFSFAPFIVTLLAGAAGGRFRKNVLLMSLMMSLVFSVVYYVAQMIMILFAKLGYIAPIMGAWSAFFIFLILGTLLLRAART